MERAEHSDPAAGPRDPVRPEVAIAWQRAALHGLAADALLHSLAVADVDTDSRLVGAVKPLADQLEEDFAETGFGLIIADQSARLIQVRSGQRRLVTDLQDQGIAVGRLFAEETTGNNSVATAHELRTAVAVRGDEHFLEALRGYVCYGHPVINWLTGRVEGVLSVVGRVPHDNPLLAPYLARTVRELERQLIQGARLRDQHMLATFQVASARHQDPVLVLGPQLTLANPAAMEQLDRDDHLRLRLLAADPSTRSAWTSRIGLTSGLTMIGELSQIPDAPGGVLVRLRPAEPQLRTSGESLSHTVEESCWPRQARRLLITGEPGTGKSTQLRKLADDHELDLVTAGDLSTAANEWLSRLGRLAAVPDGVLAIEDIHLLDAATALRVRSIVQATARKLAMTGPPPEVMDPAQADLAALCPARIELLPLRERRTELAGLASAMLAAAGANRSVRFTPMALEVLAANPWPGNLRELDTLVREVLRGRSAGDITPADLPAAYQISPRRRWMTPLERAEHDTIIAALRLHEGNKAQTARDLGISRTTLYNRMRTLRIPMP